MLTKVYSGTNIGILPTLIIVEVDVASIGLPNFTIVGLGDKAIEEAKDRVRAALRNSGADFPPKKITVNLAPADLPKIGPIFDLAIAIGILISSGQIEADVSNCMFLGELSLDGSLRSINGALPLTFLAQKEGIEKVFVPESNISEAALVSDDLAYGVKDLVQLVSFFQNLEDLKPSAKQQIQITQSLVSEYDFSQIKGQEQAKRAFEIAAAGSHNILLKGPPGSGKTLLSKSFPSILPSLSSEEALELTMIYSSTGHLPKDKPYIDQRPFRSPHHTASYVGIIGGGNKIKPGEVSLAHRGVLFLDELPEFPRQVLEALRQPLEEKQVVVSRASGSVTFPAQFILVAAQNPCPCGFFGSAKKSCICIPGQVAKYRKKISGPLLDRIDIHLEVPEVEIEKLSNNLVSENSTSIRQRVDAARKIQLKRFKSTNILTNSEMNNTHLRQLCSFSEDSMIFLKQAANKLNLSARSFYRVMKLSQTIADLDSSNQVEVKHISESLQYRPRDDS